jgi:hypothetical protein
LTGRLGRGYQTGVPIRTASHAWIMLRKLPRDLTLAWVSGLGVGILACAAAYAFYGTASGPNVLGASIIPLSAIVVGALYVVLARRRMVRASDWLALGYTAAILLSLVALTVREALHEFYLEMTGPVW